MDQRPWLEQVRSELARRRLPPRYVARLLRELSDHLADFMEDPMSTDANDLRSVVRRLGRPAQLAEQAAVELQRGRFSGRHPVLMFVLLPILAVPLWLTALVLALISLGYLHEAVGEPLEGSAAPSWLGWIGPLLLFAVVSLGSALWAGWFCRLARRATVSWRWPLAACLIVALVAGTAVGHVKVEETRRQVQVGLGIGLQHLPTAMQLAQCFLPAALGGFMLGRQALRNRSWPTAS